MWRIVKSNPWKYAIQDEELYLSLILKMPTEKEAAEAIIKIGGGLIERKHLEKWIKRLKFKENMDLLKNLFVEQ